MTGRVVAIVNPVSGRRDMMPMVRQVARLFQTAGIRLELAVTSRPGEATRLAGEAADQVDAVLAVGGDGTVREIVDGLVGSRTPIVILGSGTENLLARELRMPTRPRHVVEAVLNGESIRFDVGRVNGQSFLAVVGVGFDAECVARLSRMRRGHITHGDYFWPIWRTFWDYRFPLLAVEADDRLVFEGHGLALVAGISRYSAGLRVLPAARCDDGLLDLVVFPCRSRWELAAHAWRVFRREHMRRGGSIHRQCRRIRVTSSQVVPIEVDGDSAGKLPIEVTICPSAVIFHRCRNERPGI